MVTQTGKESVINDLPTALRWGAGLGAVSGALSSNNPISDEYETLAPNQI